MSETINWFHQEMDKMSEDDITNSPDYEIQEGDKVVGTIESIKIKKIWNLVHRLDDEIMEKKKEIAHKAVDARFRKSNLNEDDDQQTRGNFDSGHQLEILQFKRHSLKTLFDASVLCELSEEAIREYICTRSAGINLSSEWEVVLVKSQDIMKDMREPISLLEFLRFGNF